MSIRRALIYGANGALGKDVLGVFARKGWKVHAVDVSPIAAPAALYSGSTLLSPSMSIQDQLDAVRGDVKDQSFHAVINIAGGWAGGNAADPSTAAATELMLRQSIWSSMVSVNIAATLGQKDVLLVLPGSAGARNPTSFMLGYGLAKAGVHHLVKSVASDPSVLPAGACVLGMLPSVLDTPGNRKAMPDVDRSTWVPTEFVAGELAAWAEGVSRPTTGTLVVFEWENGKPKLSHN